MLTSYTVHYNKNTYYLHTWLVDSLPLYMSFSCNSTCSDIDPEMQTFCNYYDYDNNYKMSASLDLNTLSSMSFAMTI